MKSKLQEETARWFSHINNLLFSVFDSKKEVWDEAVSYIHFLFLLHCNKHYRCPFFVS